MKSIALLTACFLALNMSLAEKSKKVDLVSTTAPNQKIEINGLSGSNITFKSWEKNEVAIKLNVSISSSDKEFEQKYIDYVQVSQSTFDGSLIFELKELNSTEGRSSSILNIFKRFYLQKDISGEIYVPQSNSLSTDMRYGSLALDNMKGDLRLIGTSNTLKLTNCSSIKEIENNYGKTWITNSGGAMKLIGTSSTVTIKDFDGSLDLDADYSTVTAARIKRSISILDRSGKISIDDIHGDAKLNADYSTITMNGIEGFAEIHSTSGSISIRRIYGVQIWANYTNVDIANVRGIPGKPVIVDDQSGNVNLKDVASDVQIDNPYSRITLTKIKGNVDLNITSSTVSADDITGDWSCRSQYSTLDLHRLNAKNVKIKNSSNPIDITLLNIPNSIDIKNQYGSVSVQMPEGFSGSIDMNAVYGNVTTSFPLKIKTQSSSTHAVGKVGTGTGTISIETESGNISINP